MKIPPSQVLEKQKLSVTRNCWVWRWFSGV